MIHSRFRRQSWGLQENYQKQSKTFSMICDEISIPIFILDHSKKIIFSNLGGNNLIKEVYQKRQQPKNINFLYLIKETFHQKISMLLKQTKGKNSTKFTATLNVSSETVYEINFKQIIWKSQSNYLCTLNNYSYAGKTLEVLQTLQEEQAQVHQNLNQKMDEDFTKWNNLLRLHYFNESDLKIMSLCIFKSWNLQNILFRQGEMISNFSTQLNLLALPFNIKHTIINALEVCYVLVKDKNYEFSVKFEESFPSFVIGDHPRIQQIFYILMKLFILNYLAPEKENRFAANNNEDEEFQDLNIGCFFSKVIGGNEVELRFEVEYQSSRNMGSCCKGFSEQEVPQLQSLFDNKEPEKLDFYLFNQIIQELGGSYNYNLSNNDSKIKVFIYLIFQNGNEAQYLQNVSQRNNNDITVVQRSKHLPNNYSFCRINKSQNSYVWKKHILELKKVSATPSGTAASRWINPARKQDPSATLMNIGTTAQSFVSSLPKANDVKSQIAQKRSQINRSSSKKLTKLPSLDEIKEENNEKKSQNKQKIKEKSYSQKNIVKVESFNLKDKEEENNKPHKIISINNNNNNHHQNNKNNNPIPESTEEEIKENLNSEQKVKKVLNPEEQEIIKQSLNKCKKMFQQSMYQTLAQILVKNYNIEINGDVILSDSNRDELTNQQYKSKTLASITKTQEARRKKSMLSQNQSLPMKSPLLKMVKRRMYIEQIPANLLGCSLEEQSSSLSDQKNDFSPMAADQSMFAFLKSQLQLSKAMQSLSVQQVRKWI